MLFSGLFFLTYRQNAEAATGGVLQEKVFLEISQNSQKNSCARVYNFIKKETMAQVFFYEFSEISKNTFPTEQVWATFWFFIIALNA